ncbi:phage tail protein [Methyloterricola oryzae]|uniref:phage tail protein n=1 Tax=Methyloterricola oryzae TaxID=1495050 RepID=UPI0005EB721D|nr:phage tail protein [Methyloterricola oryzae]
MNQSRPDRLYELLPSIYRQRDLDQGEPLRALLGVMQQQLEVLEADVGALYENWFIETCDEWVVPYIGDLLGMSGLGDFRHPAVSQRARVAKTLGYRRRKGVSVALEEVIQDSTGWSVSVVEFFERITANQNVRHVRDGKGMTTDVRNRAAVAQMYTAFNECAFRPEMRRINSGRGRFNRMNVGVLVWRLASFPMHTQPARAAGNAYRFDPLGTDVPLFNRAMPRAGMSQKALAPNLPIALSNDLFQRDLEACRKRSNGKDFGTSDFYGPNRALCIYRNDSPIPAHEVMSATLNGNEWENYQIAQERSAAIDVTNGRFVLRQVGEKDQIDVSYHYGFSGELGGGPYRRVPSSTGLEAGIPTLTVGGQAEAQFPTLKEAIASLSEPHAGGSSVIRIMDSGVYELEEIQLNAAGSVVIEAASGAWPSIRGTRPLRITASGECVLTLQGLRLGEPLELEAANGQLRLELSHCSIPKGVQAINIADVLQVTIAHNMVGPIRLPGETSRLVISDSIVCGSRVAIGGALDTTYGPGAQLSRATVFGEVNLQSLELASEVLFTDPVSIYRSQSGGMRFCYVPEGSFTPQRYRCQPDLALATQGLSGQAIEEKETIRRRLTPSFTSRQWGSAGFAQLSMQCALEIRRGAEDGGEMGAFHSVHAYEREANLAQALDEYLPSSLEAGIFYVT